MELIISASGFIGSYVVNGYCDTGGGLSVVLMTSQQDSSRASNQYVVQRFYILNSVLIGGSDVDRLTCATKFERHDA